jgi:RND family efflux transporter, MFP subunit
MKKRTIIILAVLIPATAAAIYYFTAAKKAEPITFVTTKAQYGYIAKSVTATGTIQPVDTVSVGAQVSGVVKNVYVDFNSIVKKGQLLAKVDPSIITSQAEQSRANLANAQSNLDYQKNNFNRQQQLFNLGAISKADYQVALNQYNSAKAVVANNSAQVRLATKNLSYTDIYSPISGVVLNRNVSEGQTIASSFNAPTLFVIAKDLTKMQVRAAVDEADIGGVKPAQHVSFTVDAYPDDIFEGEIQEILLRASVSANVVTYTTLVNVDNNAMKLKPGMTASINIYLEEDTNALLIPSKALTFKPDSVLLKKYTIRKAERKIPDTIRKEKSRNAADSANRLNGRKADIKKSYVWVKTGDTLTQKRIITGINDDTYVMVIKGLSTDEEVVTGIVIGENKLSATNPQRSPFMPQMRRSNAPARRQ